MSTLQCANIHFESTANNRVQYFGSNNIAVVVAGSNSVSMNTSSISFTANVSFSANVTSNIVCTSNISDFRGNVRDIPINNQTTLYTTVADDNGEVITTTANVTVNASVFSTVSGQAISIYNNSAASITIIPGTGTTMYLGGTATTGNRTLAQRGIATVLLVAANTFVISGAGLT
jgi:hypothetical protein